jgi:hypothetical protein
MSNQELEYLDTLPPQELDPVNYYKGPYYEGPEGGADDILNMFGIPKEAETGYKPGPRDYSRQNEGRWRLDHGGRSRRRRAHRARRSRKAMRAGTRRARRARRAARRASRR